MIVSLTGHTTSFPNNLQGKELNYTNPHKNDILKDIIKIKKMIAAQFIMPICRHDWTELHQNMFNLTRLQKKIKELQKQYGNQDLHIYSQILESVFIAFNEHSNLNNLEQEYYGANKNNTARLIQKTNYIRLKAEYELYNLIIGKPKKRESYNTTILELIKKLLQDDDISFNDISKQINIFNFLK